jgi:hypothetical protein
MLLSVKMAFADSVNVELSGKSARFVYASELYGSQYGPMDMEFSGFFNEDDDSMFTVGFLIRNDTLDSPLVISIGTRAYYADTGNAPGQTKATVAALTIGGEILYIPANLKGFGFGAHVFVAPKIVTFMDADGFMEYGGRVEYEITKQSSIYVGYSKAKIELKAGGSANLEGELFVGIGMRF